MRNLSGILGVRIGCLQRPEGKGAIRRAMGTKQAVAQDATSEGYNSIAKGNFNVLLTFDEGYHSEKKT